MSKIPLLAGLAILLSQSAYAATTCLPSNTNPSNGELLKAIACLEKVLNSLPPSNPGNPTNPTDANAVHFGDAIDLRFADVSWCLARGDAGDNKAYTLQCAPGAPGSGQTRITVDKHQ